MGLIYRLRQLRDNVAAGPLSAEARAEVAANLSPAEQALFFCFNHADQWHSVRVLRMLRKAGYNHPDLLAAALLHDVGKTRHPLSPWDRTAIVVAEKLVPARAETWGHGAVEGWRRPFVVRACHPAWGAQMAAAAGARPGVVELIARHQDRPAVIISETDRLLACLQWADDRN